MPTLNSLSGHCKQSGKSTIASFVLLAICLFGRVAEAQYGDGNDVIASAETSIYVFLSEQSTVVKTGGIAGVHETYSIEGQFQFTVDFDAGTASFDQVDANLVDESPLLPTQSLGVIFNMAELLGTVVDDTTIDFVGKTADGMESDILLTLTFRGDSVHLTGRTVPPPNSADFFIYELDAVASKKNGGGNGEPNYPYLIYTAEQMNAIGAEPNHWDMHFKLMADIDLSGYTGKDFNIIGYYVSYDSPDNKPFTGVFDGNGHRISNFSYISTDINYIGLFGYVDDPNAQIKNLVLIDPNIDAGTAWGVGSLVGYLDDGTISNCYVEGGSVSGGEDVGGLVGIHSGAIINCYSTGSIIGNNDVGGLVGTNVGTIIHCYATGSVTGTTNVSGLVGRNEHGEVTSSFWDIQTSGQTTSAGGIGKTTTEMQTAGTFLDAGWDFVDETANGTEDIWSICEGTNYPRLVWQIPAGDFVCPDGITIEDFLFFIEHWRDDNCDLSNDYCQGTDLDFSGTVDRNDLEIFLENWLAAVRSD